VVKLFNLFFGALFLSACSTQTADSFSGKEYKLQNVPENVEITLGFDRVETRFFGVAAINRYFGSYSVEGEVISFGPAGSTMMAGPEELMKAEQEYLRFLPTVSRYKLNGKTLSLFSRDGKELVFEETGTVAEE